MCSVRFPTSLLLVLTLCLFSTGCQKENDRSYTVYPVDGQLYYLDKPATGAMLTFHPQEADNPATSLTCTVRIDGHFVPVQPDGAIGLPAGSYRLTAVFPQGDRDQFEGKYGDLAKPLMTIQVNTTVNLLPPIRLP